LLLPAVLALLPKLPASDRSDPGAPLTAFFAGLTERHGRWVVLVALALITVTAIGVARLEVENSFIKYFKSSTEIHRGMKFLDENLGGTTPLEILINFAEDEPPDTSVEPGGEADEDFDMFDEFDSQPDDSGAYWFTQSRLDRIHDVHQYLDGLPALGKVLSLATLVKSVEDLNGGEPLDNFTLAVLFGAVPDSFQEAIIDPYVSVENNEARIITRIKDSMESLRRDALLEQIRCELVDELGFEPKDVRLSGVMVLYNNMLQSLFRSQVETVGITAGALLIMFLMLFRSLKVALIAMFPNLISTMSVLGVMGLAGLPLDMMTITIVAISLGIAVDNTIHYLHRFKREVAMDGDYVGAMHRSHGSIGYAMTYTSLTITAGFSIFAFSNFIPTVLFGLLTALAMLTALAAALSLLPRLIIMFKPFGPDGRKA
jgi:predicted RND superfamily exporter protein